MSRMHQAFISHSTHDREFAESVCKCLENAGIKSWIAPRDIPAAAEYDEALVDAIERTRIVVLILSEAAKASQHVRTEVGLAKEEGKKFITIRLEDVRPTQAIRYAIGTTQYLDAFNRPRAKVLQDLIEAAARHRNVEPGPSVTPLDLDASRNETRHDAIAKKEPLSAAVYLLIFSSMAALVLLSVVASTGWDRDPRGGKTDQKPDKQEARADTQSRLASKAVEAEERLAAIGRRLQTARVAGPSQTNSLVKSLEQDRLELLRLVNEWESRNAYGVAAAAGERLAECEQALTRLKTLAADSKTKKALDGLDAIVGNADRFESELKRIAREYTEASLAAGLKAVASEKEMWVSVLAWDAFYKNETYLEPSLHTPTTVRRLNQKAAELPIVTPLTEPYAERKRYFQKIAARRDVYEPHDLITAGWLSKLKTLRMRELYVVEIKDGSLLYMRVDPTSAEPDRRGNYLFNVTIREFDVDQKIAVPQERVARRGRAPHCDLTRAIVATLERDSRRLDSEWVEVFTDLIPVAVNAEGVDPIPHLLICRELIDVAGQGSESIEIAFSEIKRALKAVNVDPMVNWLDSANDATQAERRLCREAFRTLPSVSDAVIEAKRRQQAFHEVEVPQIEWVGWLNQDGPGEWRLAGPRGYRKGSLSVALPAGSGRVLLEEVGVTRDGKAVWVPSSKGLKLGRPVFLKQNDPVR